jgi:hypothetical protein
VAAEALTVSVGPASATLPVQEITFFDSLKMTFNVDAGDSLTFAVPAFSPEAVFLDELASDIWVDGIVRQRYRVIDLSQAWDEDGNDQIAVTAVSYKRLLRGRNLKTALDFGPSPLVEQGDIIWALIAHTQAQPGGNWRVTKGVTATGQLRERHYVIGENIGDLADKLSGVINGCWYGIDADLVFTAKLPSAFSTWSLPLQLGVTARRMARKGAADKFANAVLASGDNMQTTPVWAEVAGIATDARGRWEATSSHPSVIVQSSLVEMAQGDLSAAMNPPATWTAEIEPDRWVTDAKFMPGEYVIALTPQTLAAPIGAPPLAYKLQVIETSVTYTADGDLAVSLSAAEISTFNLIADSARVGTARVGVARVGVG